MLATCVAGIWTQICLNLKWDFQHTKCFSSHRILFIYVDNGLVKVVKIYRKCDKTMLLDIKFNCLLLRVSYNAVSSMIVSCLSEDRQLLDGKTEVTMLYILIIHCNLIYTLSNPSVASSVTIFLKNTPLRK